MPKQLYNDQYVKFGFIELNNSGESLPQCVLYMKALSNAAMKFYNAIFKLIIQTRKTVILLILSDFGKMLRVNWLDKTGKQYQQSAGIVTASYEIALLVAKNKNATQ